MTEAELEDLEECSEMFDFDGFVVEDDRRLIAALREARKIARHCRNILHACGLYMGEREEREAPEWLTAERR